MVAVRRGPKFPCGTANRNRSARRRAAGTAERVELPFLDHADNLNRKNVYLEDLAELGKVLSGHRGMVWVMLRLIFIIPLSDDNPRGRIPAVTIWIITLWRSS